MPGVLEVDRMDEETLLKSVARKGREFDSHRFRH